MKRFSFSVFCMGLVFAASGAVFGYPDFDACTVQMPNIGDATPVIFVLPAEGGTPLSEARNLGTCEVVDATIEVMLVDHLGQPMHYTLPEELSLGSPGGSFETCGWGAFPDYGPDENGIAYWISNIGAYGRNEGELDVLLNYTPISGQYPQLNIWVNSADMNGDGTVNIVDVSNFSEHYFGTYDFSADYFPDGVLNLADVVLLALGLGQSCP